MGYWYVTVSSTLQFFNGSGFGVLMEHVNIGKERRETAEFIGAEGVRAHLKDGPPRRRVGLVVEGAPARRRISAFFSKTSQLSIVFRWGRDFRYIW